ncbi:MAG: hypothetical protein JNK75_01760 [Betaproteobacteria bacterium]|nr:hypothetical protein [Betaproteobacteria bacterium]
MSVLQNRRKNRMPDADFAAMKALEALDTECRQLISKIRQNARMKDVAQLAIVNVPDLLRPRLSELKAVNQLTEAAEQRMRELLDGHLIELRRQSSLPALEQLRGHFLHREWTFLKGGFPLLYREAESEAEKLIRRLEYETNARRRTRPGR